MKLDKPEKHNYMKKILKLELLGKIPKGQVTEATILHDDWCGINKGGYCNCDPDVIFNGQKF